MERKFVSGIYKPDLEPKKGTLQESLDRFGEDIAHKRGERAAMTRRVFGAKLTPAIKRAMDRMVEGSNAVDRED